MATLSRPWQGTTLGILHIIGAVLAFLGGIAFLFLRDLMSNMMNPMTIAVQGQEAQTIQLSATGVAGIVGSLGLVAGLLLIGFGVLAIFITRGSFKGQKWAPIVAMIFAILGVLGNLSSFSLEKGSLVQLAVNAFVIYCTIICVKHPFYGKKA